MSTATANTIAGCFALAAFTVATLSGLAAGNPASSVLSRALIAMVVCYPIGIVVGLIAHRLVAEHVAAHLAEHSDPTDRPIEMDGDPGDEEEEVIVV